MNALPVIYIGSDHAGLQLKERIKNMLEHDGYVVHDEGNHEYEQTDDFPDFAEKVAQKVAKGRTARGILCCANGVGMCIAANRVPGVRAVRARSKDIIEEAVCDNDVNVLCLGQDKVSMKEGEDLVRAFLAAKFCPEERYQRRIKKLDQLAQVAPADNE